MSYFGNCLTDLCRKYGQFPESIKHVAGCPVKAQTVHLNHHNVITSAVHLSSCSTCGFESPDKWWKHSPDLVLQNKDLYDFNIFTDWVIAAQCCGLVLINKEISHTFLTDMVCYG